jgi:hypothetical protein
MSALKPEYGPTLPALLKARRGIAPRATLGMAALIVLAIAVAALLGSDEERGLETYVRRDAPTFSLLHPPRVRSVAPNAGEYARLRARGRRVGLNVVVRPLPPYPGPGRLTLAGLPILGIRHAEALDASLPGFALERDGRARVNDAPGYQVLFRAGDPKKPLIGLDVLLLPTDDATSGGVLLSLRQQNGRPRLRARDRELAFAMRKVFRSFRFGTERP